MEAFKKYESIAVTKTTGQNEWVVLFRQEVKEDEVRAIARSHLFQNTGKVIGSRLNNYIFRFYENASAGLLDMSNNK